MKGNRRFIDFIVEGIIFVLIVSSMTQSIIDSLYLPISYSRVLILSLFFYVLFSIYLYNRFTIFIGIPLTLYFSTFFIRRAFSMNLWHEIIKYIVWLIEHTLGNNPTMVPDYIGWSAWFITGVMSLIFFLVIIEFNFPILSIVIASVIIDVQWYLGHTHITPYIWIYALASICLIGASHRKALSKKYEMPSSGLWQLSTLPLALIIVLGSIMTVPQDTSHLKSEYLEEQLDQIEYKWTSSRKSKKTRISFRLTQTGFQTSADRLGGPIELKDGVVLKVNAPQPLYLRGTVLNEYTGAGWEDSISAMRYRFNDPLNSKTRDRILDLDESFWENRYRLEEQGLISKFTIDVEPVGIETSAIFAPLRTIAIKPHVRRQFSPYINDKGELFAANNVVDIKGYTLDIVYLNSRNRDILALLNNHIPQIDFRKYIPNDYNKYENLRDIQENYSNINDYVPKRVLELADEITKYAQTPIEKALALEVYLAQNYTYTLTPPYTPEDRDFVDYFLFDLGEGYCTYFASAMAVMGRAVGLPTRYVEGFSMPPSPKYGSVYEIQKSNSHAWVEIYFPGIGWLTFDPTPATYFDIIATEQNEILQRDYDNLDQYLDDYMDIPQYIEPEEIEPTDEIYGEVQRVQNGRLFAKIRPFVFLLYVVIALIALVVIVVLTFSYIYRRRIAKLSPSSQIEIYYVKIIGLLNLYNFPIETGETPYTYANRVDKWLINEAGSMLDMATLIVESNFSNYLPSEQDVHKVKSFYDNLKIDTKKVIGLPKYMKSTIKEVLCYLKDGINNCH